MNNLERLRLAKKMTQLQTADYCKMSLRGYRKIENGDSEPSYRATVALQKLFDERIDYLLEQIVDTTRIAEG